MKLGPDLVQLFGTAQRGVHLISVIEGGVVYLIFASLFSERNNMLEAMSPQDLCWQIAATCLRCHACGLNHTLQHYHNLESFFQHILCGQRIQWTMPVYFVHNCRRPNEH